MMKHEAQVTNLSAFRLSRVYAEGWNKARALSAKERDQVVLSGADVLNPYKSEPQRARWAAGFAEAYSL